MSKTSNPFDGINDLFQQINELTDEQDFANIEDEMTAIFFQVLETGRSGLEVVFDEYKDDPVGFITEKLNLKLTDKQIEVCESVRDNQWTLVVSATGTGKTFIESALAVWFFLTRLEVGVYVSAAPPESNLKQLFWNELSKRVRANTGLFKGVVGGDLRLERKRTKQGIYGLLIPAQGSEEEKVARFSGKHPEDGGLHIGDEADGMPDFVFTGIEGCMSTHHDRALLCLNPKQKRGWPYRQIIEQRVHVIYISAFDHPNVMTGEESIKGAVSRSKTIARIHEWSRPLRLDEEIDENVCFEVPAFLVGETAVDNKGTVYPPLQGGWRRITNPQMYYKVLGRYPAEGENQLFGEADIAAAVTRWKLYVDRHGETPPAFVQPIMGLDVASDGPDSSCAAFRYGGFIPSLEKWSGVNPNETGRHAARLYKMREPSVAYIDGTGVGAGVSSTMAEAGCFDAVSIIVGERATEISEVGRFFQLRDQAFWAFAEWLKSDIAMLPEDGELLAALRIVTYVADYLGSFIKVLDKKSMIKLLGYSPDEMDAVMMTFIPASSDISAF